MTLLYRIKLKPVFIPALFVIYFSSGSVIAQDPIEIDSLLKVVEQQKHTHEFKELAVTCTEIGKILENNGKIDEALQYYLIGINIAEKLNDDVVLAQIKISLSRVYYYRGELHKAMELDSNAKIVFHNAGEKYMEGVATLFIGFIYTAMKDYQKALDYDREALDIFIQVKDSTRISETLNAMGTVYQELGDYEKALNYYEQSMAIDDSLGNTEYVAISLSNIAGIYIELKNYPKGIENFEKAIALMNKTTSFYYLKAITGYLAESYALAGNYEKAYSTMLVHQGYADSLNSEIRQEQFLRIQEEFNTKKKENEILVLNQDKEHLADKLRSTIIIFTLSGGIIILTLLLILFYTRQRRARELHKRAELEQKALRAQMNPHFIFNSLNSLQSMFMKGDFDLANDYLGDFGELLRNILDNSGKSNISLKEELNTLDLYLSIERMRTDGMIEYEMSVDPEIDTPNTFLPPLVIQPFVENAIWHGILPTEQKGRVTIEIQKVNQNTIKCIISDNGIGISTSLLRKKNKEHQSKGMEITSQRLRKSDDLKIEELEVGGTRVTLFIPLYT